MSKTPDRVGSRTIRTRRLGPLRRLSCVAPLRPSVARLDMGDRRCVRPGCTLTARLRSDGMDVADVPANLAAPGAGAVDRPRPQER
jgi:hypothetical protein